LTNRVLSVIRESLTKIGVSVLHASVTTAGSVLPVLFADTVVFQRVGEILLISTLFSIVYALVLLPSLLAVLGPAASKDDHVFVTLTRNRRGCGSLLLRVAVCAVIFGVVFVLSYVLSSVDIVDA
jgi:multidrug efflux pump subunit AcrB